jgi:hypothetical protein
VPFLAFGLNVQRVPELGLRQVELRLVLRPVLAVCRCGEVQRHDADQSDEGSREGCAVPGHHGRLGSVVLAEVSGVDAVDPLRSAHEQCHDADEGKRDHQSEGYPTSS